MRIYKKLPCGCLVDMENHSLIPCSYPEVGERESELHKLCMRLLFREGKSVEEIWKIVKEIEQGDTQG